MKRPIYYLIAVLLLISHLSLAQTTEVYFQNDSLELEVDIFEPSEANTGKRPLFLYVHGGGFSGGNKTAGHAISQYLAGKGLVAASIQYTLYMKDKNFSCGGVTSEKVKAIQISANQLKMATLFFIENAEKYNIDPTQIFIAGASAGAECILHAAYWDEATMNVYEKPWPADFRYAGMIASSGAIMDLNLIQKDNAIPTLLSHGTCDTAVPYGTAAHHYCPVTATGWLMLFGSHSIYEHLISLDKSTQLYTYCNGSHDYHSYLFKNQKEEVYQFIQSILQKSKVQKHWMVNTQDECGRFSAPSFCE
ncbi:alpha/beta hydrolase [Reichenbachiella ulvae]|uniref:Alpha/beta hydrolase n=1 Tax=Reichenbachiella ulvae TaxID=2980104 RepID=A0ABT3CPA7_9BACT|nr:alpha/beta hydrolase [Reichenbachiella ulvae]MCV9385521.1 alpha/beta hydrolase [Reichenbachiella ulvae]